VRGIGPLVTGLDAGLLRLLRRVLDGSRQFPHRVSDAWKATAVCDQRSLVEPETGFLCILHVRSCLRLAAEGIVHRGLQVVKMPGDNSGGVHTCGKGPLRRASSRFPYGRRLQCYMFDDP
jgi:hypothetical protein